MPESHTGHGEPVDVVPHARAQEAYRLRVAGMEWSAIAERIGYCDGRVASMAVTAYLLKAAVEQDAGTRRRQLDLELTRLDSLQAAFLA